MLSLNAPHRAIPTSPPPSPPQGAEREGSAQREGEVGSHEIAVANTTRR